MNPATPGESGREALACGREARQHCSARAAEFAGGVLGGAAPEVAQHDRSAEPFGKLGDFVVEESGKLVPLHGIGRW